VTLVTATATILSGVGSVTNKTAPTWGAEAALLSLTSTRRTVVKDQKHSVDSRSAASFLKRTVPEGKAGAVGTSAEGVHVGSADMIPNVSIGASTSELSAYNAPPQSLATVLSALQ
jgi:hypothetical protein